MWKHPYTYHLALVGLLNLFFKGGLGHHPDTQADYRFVTLQCCTPVWFLFSPISTVLDVVPKMPSKAWISSSVCPWVFGLPKSTGHVAKPSRILPLQVGVFVLRHRSLREQSLIYVTFLFNNDTAFKFNVQRPFLWCGLNVCTSSTHRKQLI